MPNYIGTGGPDSWDGTSDGETARGGDGNDSLSGWGGDDLLYGEGGDDSLTGGDGNDLLDGGDGNDYLNVYFFLNQDDLLNGGTFIGGSGFDTLYFAGRAGSYTIVDLSLLTVATDIERLLAVECSVRLTRDRFLQFSQLEGGFFITGSGTFDLTGNRIVNGALRFDSGDDIVTLAGNNPNNTGSGVSVNAGAGNDQVIGAEDSNTISGQEGNDRLEGRGGYDNLQGGAGNDILIGGEGNDLLEGGADFDSYDGGAGDDTIKVDLTDSFLKTETISGGSGVDTLWIEGFGDFDFTKFQIADDFEKFWGSSLNVTASVERLGRFEYFSASYVNLTGTGTVVLGTNFQAYQIYCSDLGNSIDGRALINGTGIQAYGGAGADVLTGSQYGDHFHGGGGNDIIHGEGGRDHLRGGAGVDWVDGGEGDDSFTIAQSDDLTAGDRFTGGAGIDEIFLEISTLVDFTVITLDLDFEVLFGNPGRQARIAAANADQLLAIGLSKLYLATAGSVDFTGNNVRLDHLYLSDLGNDVRLVGQEIANAWGGAGNDVIRVASFTDTVHGGGGDDQLYGGVSRDQLYGEAGNDVLVGGLSTANVLIGGIGNDTYRVDLLDTIVENAGEGTDCVYTSIDFTLAGGVDVEILAASDALATTPLRLTGNGLNQELVGNAGNNVLDGAGGADTMFGGAGDDVYLVDAGDTVTEYANGGYDEVRTALISYSLTAQVEKLTGTSDVGQRLTGNDRDNLISGGLGDDRLEGGAGDDRLIGGLGHDQLFGGGGADTFAFLQAADSRSLLRSNGSKALADRLGDFVSGEDKIDLSALDAVRGTPANDGFTFIGSAAFGGQAGQLRVELSASGTLVMADMDGDRVADFLVSTSAGSLVASDFIL